jgi:hypothetical protein
VAEKTVAQNTENTAAEKTVVEKTVVVNSVVEKIAGAVAEDEAIAEVVVVLVIRIWTMLLGLRKIKIGMLIKEAKTCLESVLPVNDNTVIENLEDLFPVFLM